jgi:hypothetical protein
LGLLSALLNWFKLVLAMSLMALLTMVLAAEDTTPSLLMILGWIWGEGRGELPFPVAPEVDPDEAPADGALISVGEKVGLEAVAAGAGLGDPAATGPGVDPAGLI